MIGGYISNHLRALEMLNCEFDHKILTGIRRRRRLYEVRWHVGVPLSSVEDKLGIVAVFAIILRSSVSTKNSRKLMGCQFATGRSVRHSRLE